jgi:hypothetical protein
MNKHAFLKAVRVTHHYLGVFIAPAIMFFAFTGFLQMFSLHEGTKGSSYRPPYIIVKLASIHKHGALPAPDPPQTPAAPSSPKPAPPPVAIKTPPPGSYHWPEKIFFGLVAIGLFTSTLTGLYMAWKYTRRKVVIAAVFIAGLIIPILLLPL